MPMPTVNDVHINRAMTDISIAYRNANYIADQVFPIVPVAKKSDYYFTFEPASWFRDEVEYRAPGTRAHRVDYGVTSASYVCVNYALSKVVPDEVRENADVPLRPDTEATEFVTDALLRALERRVASVITTCANWASASVPTTVWSNDASDPVTDVETLRNAIVQSIGREPNVAVMGWKVWSALKKHPDLMDRIKYTERGVLTPATLGALFGIDKLLIGTAIYNSAQEGATAANTYIWGNQFWLGYVPSAPALMTPATGYVFTWGPRTVRTYREDEEHADVFEAEHATAEKITASDAGGGFYGVI